MNIIPSHFIRDNPSMGLPKDLTPTLITVQSAYRWIAALLPPPSPVWSLEEIYEPIYHVSLTAINWRHPFLPRLNNDLVPIATLYRILLFRRLDQ